MAPLTLHYQPIFQRDTKAILYYEALLRSHSQSTPDLFRQAERRQSRIPLEREALRIVLQDLESGHLRNRPFGINISPLALCEDQASWRILLRLARNQTFFLEITEDLPVHDLRRYRERLEKLAAYGVALVRDDLGCGHAHLTDMFEYPFHYAKLDQRYFHWWFPRTLAEQKRRAQLEALIQLMRQQSCYIIQEGIEKPLSPVLLGQIPDSIQGFQGFSLGHPAREPWPSALIHPTTPKRKAREDIPQPFPLS